MIQLKKYNVFLNALKRAIYNAEISEIHFADTVVEHQVYMTISPKELREIKNIHESLPYYIEEAKEELLSNMYEIVEMRDKVHLLEILMIDFLKVVEEAYPIYKVSIIDGYYLNNLEEISLNKDSIFYKYISSIHTIYYPQWIEFIHTVCLLYDIRLTNIVRLVREYPQQKVIDVFQIFLNKFGNETN